MRQSCIRQVIFTTFHLQISTTASDKLRKHLNQPGMGDVGLFHQKRLYIKKQEARSKKGVPEFSKYADVEEYIEGCHTFWVDPGLKDLSNEAKRL